MKIYKKLIYSIILAILILFSSMIFTFIPCQTSPNVPNPNYVWKTCNLSPDLNPSSNIQIQYLGYTESLTQTYLIVLIISILIFMSILHFIPFSKK